MASLVHQLERFSVSGCGDNSFWVAHWLVKQAGGRTYDYDVRFQCQMTVESRWSLPKPPHRMGWLRAWICRDIPNRWPCGSICSMDVNTLMPKTATNI